MELDWKRMVNEEGNMGETQKRISLIIVLLGSFLAPYMSSSINIALPVISKDFGMSAVLLSWVATSFLLTAAIFLIPLGKLADIYGRKKIYLYGTIIYTLSSLIAALSFNSASLIIARIMQGVGSAMIHATGIAILTSVFSPGERGKVLGMNIAAVYIGLSVGPFLGGFITQNLGWRSIFYVNVPIGIAIIYLIISKLNVEWTEAKGDKFNLSGSINYGLALASLMYGISLLPDRNGILFAIGGIAAFSFLIFSERNRMNPFFEFKLFYRNPGFLYSNLAALFYYSATFSVAFLLSLYLQYIKGLSPQYAGIVLVTQPVVMALFSPFAGKLSDKIQPGKVSSAGMALTVIGLVYLAFLTKETSFISIVAILILLGFSFALFSSPNTNAIMSSVEKKYYGIASGMFGTMRLTGQMFSMGIVMLIFSVIMGKVKITPEYYDEFTSSMKIAFIICSILCFSGIFASLKGVRKLNN